MSEALTQEQSELQVMLKQLLFYEKGPMSFLAKDIRSDTLQQILGATASCSWLGKWKLLYVTDRANRVRVVEAWQNGLRKIGYDKDAEFIERWKIAPLFVVFCQPRNLEPHRFVPAEFVRMSSIQEVGGAVRSLELLALTYGIGLHGIMGVLVPAVGEPIKEVLKIPADYEVVYFGVMGYPYEEIAQKFPGLGNFCYAESWSDPSSRT